MKRIFALLLALTMCMGVVTALTSCNQGDSKEDNNGGDTPKNVTIKAYNGSKELVDTVVPYDPQRIVTIDMAALDIIDCLDLGNRVVGNATTTIDYLMDYNPSDANGIVNVGTIKTPDLEAVATCDPDVIFIGGRLSSYFDALNAIAPVVYLATDTTYGVVASTTSIATTIASIFGKDAEIAAKVADFNDRIAAIESVFFNYSAVVGMYSGNNFNILGNDGRCSIIGRELGFNNIGVSAGETTATHGNAASWETIVALNPDYIFVMDRNNAIGSTDGNTPAKEAIENDLVKELDCYKNGNIIYLAHPNVWYTAEGGIQALDTMLKDLEAELADDIAAIAAAANAEEGQGSERGQGSGRGQ